MQQGGTISLRTLKNIFNWLPNHPNDCITSNISCNIQLYTTKWYHMTYDILPIWGIDARRTLLLLFKLVSFRPLKLAI